MPAAQRTSPARKRALDATNRARTAHLRKVLDDAQLHRTATLETFLADKNSVASATYAQERARRLAGYKTAFAEQLDARIARAQKALAAHPCHADTRYALARLRATRSYLTFGWRCAAHGVS